MTRFKIVLVPFPFDDLSDAKVRPAVCLTDPVGTHQHVVLAFISSRVPAELAETDLRLDTSTAGFDKTGLRFASTLHLNRLMTVSTSLIKRELGELPPALQSQVADKLRKLFQLT